MFLTFTTPFTSRLCKSQAKVKPNAEKRNIPTFALMLREQRSKQPHLKGETWVSEDTKDARVSFFSNTTHAEYRVKTNSIRDWVARWPWAARQTCIYAARETGLTLTHKFIVSQNTNNQKKNKKRTDLDMKCRLSRSVSQSERFPISSSGRALARIASVMPPMVTRYKAATPLQKKGELLTQNWFASRRAPWTTNVFG